MPDTTPTTPADSLIRAPWTPEQVHALNAYQSGSGMHPFTCDRDHGAQSVALIAHPDGWHCSAPPCDYRQDWAHAFMADPAAWPQPFTRTVIVPTTPDPQASHTVRGGTFLHGGPTAGCTLPGCRPGDQDAATEGPAPHACGNCEGIDPDTCLVNPDRPRGGQPAPAPVDPALQQRIAMVLFGAVSTANETPTATEQTIFATMAAAVLAELAPELERAEQGRRQDERDEIETATALARSRAIRTMSCGHHITSRCPDCNEIERGLRKQLSSALENLGAAIAHDRQPYPTAWAYQQACTALGAQRERAEQAEAALDSAYRERAHLVAWLAALHPSVITLAPDIEEPGWQIVYITADGHQMSWHIHPRDADLFTRIERVGPDDPRAQWDGHSTAEKYHRIRRHTHALTPPAAPEDTP